MMTQQDQHQATGMPCGLIRHMLVMIYDAVIVVAILMIAAAIALPLPFANPKAGEDPLYTMYLLVFWFAYLAWCWRNGGMTLGMRAWRVSLVSDPGPRPGWGQCLLRFVGAGLSALPAGAGYLWSLFDAEHLCWHDRLSKTHLLYLGKR